MPSSERIYRDSVHNIIRVDTGDAVGALVARLIDTPEFQRLRRVRQLGLAHFAYQAAEHSRFTHSLGAYHLATRILDRLASKYSISSDDSSDGMPWVSSSPRTTRASISDAPRNTTANSVII